MTIEIGGFLSIAALLLGLFAWLRRDISRLDGEMSILRRDMAKWGERLQDIAAQGERLDAQGERLSQDIAAQGERLDAQGERLSQNIAEQGERLRWDIAKQSERLTAVERGQADSRERMARLEGLLEGLREAVAGRRNAA